MRVCEVSSELMAMNEYRRHALECLVIADDNTTSSENRLLLIAMAQAWLRLAQQAEQALTTDQVLSYPPLSPVFAIYRRLPQSRGL